MTIRQWGHRTAYGNVYASVPSHHVHEMNVPLQSQTTKALRLFVHQAATTHFGLSLRQIRVFGYMNLENLKVLHSPVLLTARPDSICVTASDAGDSDDMRAEKVLQGGTEYYKDRWVVSRNRIGGSLWLRLDFLEEPVFITRVVVDWECAYATDYKWQVRTNQGDEWRTVHRSPDPNNVRVETLGRKSAERFSGVVPLHYVHTIQMPAQRQSTRSLGLSVHKPATADWGVSVWQIKVYGYKMKFSW